MRLHTNYSACLKEGPDPSTRDGQDLAAPPAVNSIEVQPGLFVPVDPALPQLTWLLDGSKLLSFLNLPELGWVRSCRVSYLRYKPGTNCLILYELCGANTRDWISAKLFSGDRVGRPSDRFRLTRYFPEHRMALMLFPCDLQMPSVGKAKDQPNRAKLLKTSARQPYKNWFDMPTSEWEPIRYKPERRCVVRGEVQLPWAERKRRFYARFYAGSEGARTADWHRLLKNRSTVRLPRLLGYSPKHRLLLVKELKGTRLKDFLCQTKHPAALAEAAQALARWHQTPIPESVAPIWWKRPLMNSALLLDQILAEEGEDRATALAIRLITRLAGEHPQEALLHGDFYFDQVVVRKDGSAGFVDLDEVSRGDPLHDVATFCAHIRLLEVSGTIARSAADWICQHFIETYAEAIPGKLPRRRLQLALSAALLKVALWPFRRFHSNWPTQVDTVLAWAEEAEGRAT